MRRCPTHSWSLTAYLLLELPRDGHADRLMHWDCPVCGAYAVITGHIRVGEPCHTPEWWEALERQQQLSLTPASRAARQEQQHRIR